VQRVITQRGPRNTTIRTSGIRTIAVRIRFIPKVRIHCLSRRAGDRQGNGLCPD
jgi:hypothetical protein